MHIVSIFLSVFIRRNIWFALYWAIEKLQGYIYTAADVAVAGMRVIQALCLVRTMRQVLQEQQQVDDCLISTLIKWVQINQEQFSH
ncbi:hypothetical protein BOW51_11430 [Solemya velesiana gill symbiont]|uniref:Uncharacterized protein n=1 Tax=Solemya velesiana gill symbiont TaxID=1918948 RepID=A0A1T2KRA4_9GAMM|nr:hypothetical protein BOW51_11430 [Solemya velesiana gill symbiont]